MTSSNARLFLLFTFAVDLLALLITALALPSLTPRLSTPSGTNALLLAVVYVLFAAGVFLLRKLQPVPPGTGLWLSPAVRGILAGLFGLFMTTFIAWQLGFFESIAVADMAELGEGEAAAYFAFAPGAWLGVSMLYILFLAFPVNETIGYPGTRYLVYAAIGLLTSAAMLVTIAAQGQAILPDTSPLLWTLIGFLLLLLLFGPPRLLYASRTLNWRSTPALISLGSLAVVCLVAAWLAATG